MMLKVPLTCTLPVLRKLPRAPVLHEAYSGCAMAKPQLVAA
jgi:hypothetical protein